MITVRISQQARLEISLAGVQASEPGRLAAFICDHIIANFSDFISGARAIIGSGLAALSGC